MTRLYISDSSSTSSSTTYAWGDAQQVDVEPNESFVISGSSYSLTKDKYKQDGRISVDLYFTFVKGKLSKVKEIDLKYRLENLTKMAISCEETGQTALADQILREQAFLIKCQEVAARGYDKYLRKEDVTKFMNRTITHVSLDPVENFPRPIPKDVRGIISHLRYAKVFDELMILHHNPSQEQIRSTKDKIISKDPVLFGVTKLNPDVYFFVADWEDEVCDLTFDKIVKQLKLADPTFSEMRVEPVSEKQAKEIVAKAYESIKRLEQTRPSNYRSLALQEEMKHKTLMERVRTLWNVIRGKS